MKRYKLEHQEDCRSYQSSVEEHESGEWVKWEDVKDFDMWKETALCQGVTLADKIIANGKLKAENKRYSLANDWCEGRIQELEAENVRLRKALSRIVNSGTEQGSYEYINSYGMKAIAREALLAKEEKP